jgi:predicted transport protein
VIEKPGRRTVAYKLTKNFAEILIRKDRLIIDLSATDYDDPKLMVEKLALDYVVTLNHRITLSSPCNLEYVFNIIEQSYQNVL